MEEKKQFEIAKDQISSIEIKQPHIPKYFGIQHNGHLLITGKSGVLLEVTICAR
jgi:hypothetical protein